MKQVPLPIFVFPSLSHWWKGWGSARVYVSFRGESGYWVRNSYQCVLRGGGGGTSGAGMYVKGGLGDLTGIASRKTICGDWRAGYRRGCVSVYEWMWAWREGLVRVAVQAVANSLYSSSLKQA